MRQYDEQAAEGSTERERFVAEDADAQAAQRDNRTRGNTNHETHNATQRNATCNGDPNLETDSTCTRECAICGGKRTDCGDTECNGHATGG